MTIYLLVHSIISRSFIFSFLASHILINHEKYNYNAVAMQFVNFTEIMSKPTPTSRKEADFALSVLMEIPAQFRAAMHLQLLG
jgi:hypothetical protein